MKLTVKNACTSNVSVSYLLERAQESGMIKLLCRMERELNWELAGILWITECLRDTRRWTTQQGDCHLKSSGEQRPPLLLAVSQRRENSKELLPYRCSTPSLKCRYTCVSHRATTSHRPPTRTFKFSNWRLNEMTSLY